MPEMSIEDYLKHRTSTGGRANYLGKWKDREASGNVPAMTVDTWLHTRASIGVVWRHQLPRIAVLEGRDGGRAVKKVWSQNPVCHEDESVLKMQYKRDDDGRRKEPPQRCPICLLVEWVRQQVESGKLDWLAPVFEYRGSTEKDIVIVRAGGLYNAYSADDLSNDELDAMKEVGLYQKDAWKQNAMAKASSIFRVVDHHHPGEGVQIAIETGLLGDKVKGVVADAIERKRAAGRPAEEGNPAKHPYAIRWQYRPKEAEFGKKYHAMQMEYALSPEVEHLIRGTEPPSIDHLLRHFNAASLRAELEKVAQIDIPWDRLFGAAEREQASEGDAPPKRATSGKREARAADPSPPAAVEDMFACDSCEKPMRASDPSCPHCGHVYEVEESAPPPPKQLPKRSQVRAARAAHAPQAKPKPHVPDPYGDETDDGFEDPPF